jgi:hypothetical protein
MSIDLICPFGINSSALTAGNIIVSNELNYNKNEIKIK